MISVLVAEDHSVVRMGIVMLVRDLHPDAAITECETLDEALASLRTTPFNLLLLDIHLPGGNNLQMVGAVKLRRPDVPILILSGYEEEVYALPYLDAGASGYVSKKSSPALIREAIQTVLKGERYLSPKVMGLMLQQRRKGALNAGQEEALSARELEVMQLMIRGAGASEIKNLLNIRDSTVSTYKSNIFRKMGVDNIVDLVNKVRVRE